MERTCTIEQMAFRLLLLVPLLCVTISEAVDYGDLQFLGGTCFPRDTCSSGLNKFPNASCECDNLCLSYNDCCIDAPVVLRGSSVQRRVGLTCLSYGPHVGVYAVGKCLGSWNGPLRVRMKCENQDDDYSDPMLSMPATDTMTHVTYRNRYCAECNNANPNNLSTWSPTLTCDSLKSVNEEFRNITYDFVVLHIDHVGGNWGVNHWNKSKGSQSFYPCDVSHTLPKHLERHVRHCMPDMISTCPTKWNRQQVRVFCQSYTAVVFFKGQAYRNVHCARCNVDYLTSVDCLPPSIQSRAKPPLSFTLLVDVNPRDGNMVGVTSSCPAGEKYDPFFRKCRALVCAIPGHVLRNGRCVRN